jgi:hypothetical protein
MCGLPLLQIYHHLTSPWRNVKGSVYTDNFTHYGNRSKTVTQWDMHYKKYSKQTSVVSHQLINYTKQSPSWEANSRSASQDISPFYEIRRFINAFTKARHLSLSWPRWIQATSPYPNFLWYIIILSFHLHSGLLRGLIPSGFPTKILYATARSARELYHLQFSFQAASPETFGYTLV